MCGQGAGRCIVGAASLELSGLLSFVGHGPRAMWGRAKCGGEKGKRNPSVPSQKRSSVEQIKRPKDPFSAKLMSLQNPSRIHRPRTGAIATGCETILFVKIGYIRTSKKEQNPDLQRQ